MIDENDKALVKKLNEAAELRISKTRSNLLMKQPFFGLMALRLRLKPSYAVSVMAVSKTTLYFNPEVVNTLPKHSLIFIVAHEIMHKVLLHHFRMTDPKKYPNADKVNIAQDYAINGILIDEGFQVPDEPYGPLHNKKYDGLSAENIYKMLPDDMSDKTLVASGMGTVISEELTPDKQRLEELKVKQEIAEAKDAAKMQGKLPGGLEEVIEEIIQVKVDWKKQLHVFFNEFRKEGYSWSKPNRRFISQNIYLPSHLDVPTGHVAICIDTSGSLREDELADFMSEINGILLFAKPRLITVVQCDTRINSIDTFTQADLPINITAKGRGGTNFEPIFNAIEEGRVEPPAVLVYLTDLEATFPEKAPLYPVVWLASDSDEDAPFGTTIHIN